MNPRRLPTLLLAAGLVLSGSAGVRGEEPAPSPAGLDACYAIALDANPDLGAAVERGRQASFRGDAGFGALLPQLSLSGTAFRQTLVETSGGGTVVSTSDRRDEVRLRLDQAITRFGTEWKGISELDRLEQAGRADLADTLRWLYAAVAEAFCEALYREREIGVRAETVRAAQERLREMDARREVGLSRRAESLRIQAQLSRETAALEEARTGLELARRALDDLLGRPVGRPLDPTLPPPPEPHALDGAAVEEAVAARADVVAAQLRLDAAELRVGVVRGEFLPRLDLSGNWYLYRSDGYSQFQRDTDWDATLSLGFSVFSGGSSRARIAEAESVARGARIEFERVRREAEREIRDAMATLRSAAARLADFVDGAAAAEESARLVQEEYRQGISTSLEVETAEAVLRESRLDVARQELRLYLAAVALDAARGRLPAAAAERLARYDEGR